MDVIMTWVSLPLQGPRVVWIPIQREEKKKRRHPAFFLFFNVIHMAYKLDEWVHHP